VIVAHDAFDDVVHEQFDPVVTVIVPVPPAGCAVIGDGATVNVQAALGCVMVNVCPPIVSVVVLAAGPVFELATKVTFPDPLPDMPLEIDTQSAPLEAVQVQPAAVVTATVPLPPVAGRAWLVGEIVIVHDDVGCVTVYVWPAIVMVPVRFVAPVFAATA